MLSPKPTISLSDPRSADWNETQIQRKLHFPKTVQKSEEGRSSVGTHDNVHNILEAETRKSSIEDIVQLYDIHKNFHAYDTSELSVEEIMNTVFLRKRKKIAKTEYIKLAQMCAQSYICQRVCKKAIDLQLTAYFYTPNEPPKTKYEELTYILVDKHKLAGIARKILKCPGKVLLQRCAESFRRSSRKSQEKTKKRTPKRRRGKFGGRYLCDESLQSIVGKFPNLIIPKLTAKEIEYHTKAKLRFDLKTKKMLVTLKPKKSETLKKTKHGKENKENFSRNKDRRRSSRLVAKEKMTSFVETNCAEEDHYQNIEDDMTIVETQQPLDNIVSPQKEDTIDKQLPNLLSRNKEGRRSSRLDAKEKMTSFVETNCAEEDHYQNIEDDMTIDETQQPLDNIVSPEKEDTMDKQLADQHVRVSYELENLNDYQDVDYQNDQQNSNRSEFIENMCMETEPVDCQKASSVMEISNQERYLFQNMNKTGMVVTEDACRRLKKELGFDEDIVKSLRELYERVHDGTNNYVYCELVY